MLPCVPDKRSLWRELVSPQLPSRASDSAWWPTSGPIRPVGGGSLTMERRPARIEGKGVASETHTRRPVSSAVRVAPDRRTKQSRSPSRAISFWPVHPPPTFSIVPFPPPTYPHLPGATSKAVPSGHGIPVSQVTTPSTYHRTQSFAHTVWPHIQRVSSPRSKP